MGARKHSKGLSSLKIRQHSHLVSEPLIEEISKIKEQGNFGLIHSDLHQTNCLWHKKQLCLIDFHDCCIASYLSKRNLPDHVERAINSYMLARAFDIIEWVNYYWPNITKFSEGKEKLNAAIRRIEKYRVRLGL